MKRSNYVIVEKRSYWILANQESYKLVIQLLLQNANRSLSKLAFYDSFDDFINIFILWKNILIERNI